MQTARAFWADRFQRAGHTGWNDPTIYAYDQLERLAAVEAELDRLELHGGRVLDFGCGSGDFSRRMLGRGLAVDGYDPFVRPALADPGFRYFESLEALRVDRPAWDAVLAVTVLDHVLDPAELADILGVLREGLRPGGVLVMIEYSLDGAEPHASTYQAFRTTKEWRDLLSQAGFRIDELRAIAHPERAPSPGYSAYAARWPLRLLRRVAHRLPMARAALAPFLPALARRDFARFGPGRVDASPLKLHVCRPVTGA